MCDKFPADILAPLALILASPFFFSSAVKQRQKRLFFYRQGILAEGIVVRIDEEMDDADDYTQHIPIISFMKDQDWVTMPYEGSNVLKSLKTGQIVSVLYDPQKHTDFIVKSNEDAWIEGIFGVVGLTFLVVGLIWITQIV